MTPLLNLNSNNDADFNAAIKYVYESYKSDLVHFLHQYGAGNSAEDICQEAFLALISRKGKTNFNLKNGMDSIKKYLKITTRRQFYKSKRKMSKTKTIELAYGTQRYRNTPFSSPEDKKYSEELLRIIVGKLSPQDKYLYYLFFEEKHTSIEIARKLNIRPVTLRVRIYRLKRKLREGLLKFNLI